MNAAFSIRAAQYEDAPWLAQLSGQLGYAVQAQDMGARLQRLLTMADHWIGVAHRHGAEALGWVHVGAHRALEYEPMAEIYGLVAAAADRRIGVGRGLVAAAEDWSRRAGFRELTVRSNVVRTEAHRFYPALGFAQVKSQHVYRKRLTPELQP